MSQGQGARIGFLFSSPSLDGGTMAGDNLGPQSDLSLSIFLMDMGPENPSKRPLMYRGHEPTHSLKRKVDQRTLGSEHNTKYSFY